MYVAVGPVGPVRPSAPVGPVGPCAPVAPVAPVGPVGDSVIIGLSKETLLFQRLFAYVNDSTGERRSIYPPSTRRG